MTDAKLSRRAVLAGSLGLAVAACDAPPLPAHPGSARPVREPLALDVIADRAGLHPALDRLVGSAA
ncbi:hypothetical protein ABZ816_30700 [Actinosynnema sp. NPDC047251]|uniref:hypothetical protein n=1 Tax=Saccharothrix espanaensis TaxID=103731 RepID=UPI0002E0DF54|nr:hypothetical protein [Saccharothrix espanaensis]